MRSFIKIITFFLVTFILLPSSADGVFKWKDKHGKTQYGDKPPQGVKTEPFKMPAITVIQNYGKQWKPSNKTASSADKGQSPPASSNSSYSSLEILAPKAGQAIRANDGDVTLMLSVKPKLKKGHSIVVFLDGKQVSKGSSRAVNLPNLDRGQHQVTVNIKDAYQKTIISGSPVSFTVLRHSVLLNKNRKNKRPLGINTNGVRTN